MTLPKAPPFKNEGQGTLKFQIKGWATRHYMQMNPVKRRLVSHPKDWPWSSFSFYARKENGLVRIDPLR